MAGCRRKLGLKALEDQSSKLWTHRLAENPWCPEHPKPNQRSSGGAGASHPSRPLRRHLPCRERTPRCWRSSAAWLRSPRQRVAPHHLEPSRRSGRRRLCRNNHRQRQCRSPYGGSRSFCRFRCRWALAPARRCRPRRPTAVSSGLPCRLESLLERCCKSKFEQPHPGAKPPFLRCVDPTFLSISRAPGHFSRAPSPSPFLGGRIRLTTGQQGA
mmetsp:Transcript_65871/g.155132  ORF Transcript_65871/g.155132 Transcript_65871/m.155132 type:complete len:214 (+) Transcript_65871:833-1474(+)